MKRTEPRWFPVRLVVAIELGMVALWLPLPVGVWMLPFLWALTILAGCLVLATLVLWWLLATSALVELAILKRGSNDRRRLARWSLAAAALLVLIVVLWWTDAPTARQRAMRATTAAMDETVEPLLATVRAHEQRQGRPPLPKELETTVLPGPSMLFPRVAYTSDGVSWSLVAESTDAFLFGILVHGRNRSGGVPVGNWTHYDW